MRARVENAIIFSNYKYEVQFFRYTYIMEEWNSLYNEKATVKAASLIKCTRFVALDLHLNASKLLQPRGTTSTRLKWI